MHKTSFNQKFSRHVVFNLRAEHLEKSDVTGKSDPYVVLSCQGRKYETKVENMSRDLTRSNVAL